MNNLKLNKKAGESNYFFKNKKADIAITILVLGVLALMIFALLSFYLVEERIKAGGVNSAYYLQEIYNSAESVKFSDENLAYKYGASKEEGKFVLSKTITGKEGGFFGIGGEEVEIIKIKYVFDK